MRQRACSHRSAWRHSGGGGIGEQSSLWLGGGGMTEQSSLWLGGGGMAERSSAWLGGGGMAERSSAWLGGGGMAEQSSAWLGGGGITEQSRAVLGGGGIAEHDTFSVSNSILLMLRLAPAPRPGSDPSGQLGSPHHDPGPVAAEQVAGELERLPGLGVGGPLDQH